MRFGKKLREEIKNKEDCMLQLRIYQEQLKLVMGENENYRLIRHDMKHHIIALKNLMDASEYEKASKYLESMSDYMGLEQTIIKTGNAATDSILNYYYRELSAMGGVLKADIKIAENLPLEDFDLNIVLSNLLSNACEAVARIPEKVVYLNAKYDRGITFIRVQNEYAGVIKRQGERFLSGKSDIPEQSHGLGLLSVRKTVDKYGGKMLITTDNNIFKVEIWMHGNEDCFIYPLP